MRRALTARAQKEGDETGAVAVLVGLLAIVIFACAALAVDISSLAMERQKLHDHVDSAAHAGAFELAVERGQGQDLGRHDGQEPRPGR